MIYHQYKTEDVSGIISAGVLYFSSYLANTSLFVFPKPPSAVANAHGIEDLMGVPALCSFEPFWIKPEV